jgi:hypothetical protein
MNHVRFVSNKFSSLADDLSKVLEGPGNTLRDTGVKEFLRFVKRQIHRWKLLKKLSLTSQWDENVGCQIATL